ncbi:Nampt, partial [Symbiodinium microadriaticum]
MLYSYSAWDLVRVFTLPQQLSTGYTRGNPELVLSDHCSFLKCSNCVHLLPDKEVLMECIPWTENIILLSDSYKVSHWKQYPPGTQYVYSYFESRGCENDEWKEVVFFGLQYFIKRYLLGQVVTKEKIDEAAELYEQHFGDDKSLFYREGWEYILKEHGGRLPVHIKAVPEGMVIPTKTALFTLVNT